MKQMKAIRKERRLKIKRFVALGACVLLCAGMSACDKGGGDLAGNPNEQIGKMMETPKATEIPEDAVETETEISTEKPEEPDKDMPKGQTYYNSDLGFQVTVPQDWEIAPEDVLPTLDDNVIFLARRRDDVESIILDKEVDTDASVKGAANIMNHQDAYCKESLRQMPEYDNVWVDTIEIDGIEYVLTVSHYKRGGYTGFFIYGEKDGVYNVIVSAYSDKRERIKEIMYDAFNGNEK